MFTITLAPILAFLLDLLRLKLQLSRRFILIPLGSLTILIFFIWAASYNFSNLKLHWVAVTITLTLVCFSGLTILKIKYKIKLILAIAMIFPLLYIAFFGALVAEYGGGSREIISKSTFKNYAAYELEPKMYEDYKTLIVNKTLLNNLLNKTIYETSFTDSTIKYDCFRNFMDRKTELKYDLCNHKLSNR